MADARNTSRDGELDAMQAIVDAFATLDDDERCRVLRWAADRYGVTLRTQVSDPWLIPVPPSRPRSPSLAAAIQRAWDKEFSRPFSDGIDYRQARVAAETVAGLLAKPAAHDPMTDCTCEPGDVLSERGICEYRQLADSVDEAFNPPGDDVAEVAILIGAVERAAKFIGEQPCACTLAMVADWDQCARCAALGQRDGKPVQR